MAQGTTTVNFGAFPGAATASVAVTGQASMLSGSLVEAWVFPVVTADHSADEHLTDAPIVMAGGVVAATGFTVFASALPGQTLYGLYTVAWAWN